MFYICFMLLNKLFRGIVFIALCSLLFSCSAYNFTKRRYSNGYYLDVSSSKKDPAENKVQVSEKKNTITASTVPSPQEKIKTETPDDVVPFETNKTSENNSRKENVKS